MAFPLRWLPVPPSLSPSLPLGIYLSIMLTGSLWRSQTLSRRTRQEGVYFSLLQWAPWCTPSESSSLFETVPETPWNERLRALLFNLIIFVSFSYQGNYSRGISTTSFLHKHCVLCSHSWYYPAALSCSISGVKKELVLLKCCLNLRSNHFMRDWLFL